MSSEIQRYPTINFATTSGDLITATKKGDRVFVVNDKGIKGEVSLKRFKEFYARNKADIERTPRQDIYVSSGRAKKDKELMRTLFYSNPFVNPFGYIPTKDGLEPTIKNPMIESLLSTIYG